MKKEEVIKILKSGGIGIIPTDTLYGLVGQALDKSAVERIHKVRQRRPDKPSIILIGLIDDLKLFGIELTEKENVFLEKYWPGELSVVLPCKLTKFKYLHRDTNTLAFRLPAKKSLLEILHQTGPLVAPSANPEGQKPADNLLEASEYFGSNVDFYYGRGDLTGLPSTLVKLENARIEILRQGVVKVDC
jgi:L-threonylcarbamoyladenylate synthase